MIKKSIKIHIYWIFLLIFSGCGPKCCDYEVVGAAEFVIDSYQIQGGKLAILEMTGEEVMPLPKDAMEEFHDTIVEGDVLNLSLYHPHRSDLQEAFERINRNMRGFEVKYGHIELPDLPPIRVSGLNLSDAKRQIEEEIQKEFADAEVFLSFHDRHIRKVELIGLVSVSSIPVDGRIRLFEVLSRAKISPDANLFMSYVLRDGCPLPVDLHALINQGNMCHNIVMRGGDKIFIAAPTDAIVMVMGEVLRPTSVNVPYGSISLPEALVAAGGIPYTGDRRCIQIIRGDLLCPKVYQISWNQLVHLPNRSMLLIPGDTVYVTEKPITQWNRFISQLLPSVSGLQAADATWRLLR